MCCKDMKQCLCQTVDTMMDIEFILEFNILKSGMLLECILFPLFSIWSRSKDRMESESSSQAFSENAEKMPPGYCKELENLCEELQTTFDGLVRPWPPVLTVSPRDVWGLLCAW